MAEQLANVKEGDRVFINGRAGQLSPTTAKRVTKTHVIVANDAKFNRKSGRIVGCDTWNIVTLDEATPEREQRYREQQVEARHRALAYKIDAVSSANCR